VDKLTAFKTESIVAVPLIFRDKTVGVIELINCQNPELITGASLKFLTLLADFAAIAISNAKNYQQIHELTITDELTGLFNSRHLHQILDFEITRCVNEKKPITLVFLDIDHFKKVNDSHGHLAGSTAISEFGHIIKKTLRSGDFGARYGGDEFVVILPETPKDEAFKFTQDLRNRINKNIFLTDMDLQINLTASFGLATFPDDADSKDAIIKVADDLMYEVKKASRDGIAAM